MQRKADDETGDAEAAGKPGEGAKVFTEAGTAREGEDGLGGEAELVRDGDADAAIADVEGEKASVWAGGQNCLRQQIKAWGGMRSICIETGRIESN